MDDEDTRRGGGADLSDNPLTAHLVVVRMESIADNLKLLDYERGFCKELNFKPISRFTPLSIAYHFRWVVCLLLYMY